MIFTGDKKREEQHAIYFSSPIGCQNTTGNLTFTYWVYNRARVEVVLIEDLPTGGYQIINEKPYVDCGTVHLNTECHAGIPPRETPFRVLVSLTVPSLMEDVDGEQAGMRPSLGVDPLLLCLNTFCSTPLVIILVHKDLMLFCTSNKILRPVLFWKTREVELELCAISIMGSDIECLPIPSGMSPAPVAISFRKAVKNFVITIRIKSFNRDFDSVVIVDDISYKATLCSDAISVFDLGEHFLSTPMLSLLLNRHINSAKELSCDFSRRAADCVWGSAESSNGGDSEIASNIWSVGHGPLNNEKFYSLTGLNTMPEGEFAVARLETGGSTLLLSEVVRCVLNEVSVQFNMWVTGSATLQVCLVDESSPSLLDCQSASPGPVVVDLPPIERPFRIALRAEAADQGMVLVDNIDVQGEVCHSAFRQFSSKTFRPLADQPDPNACRLLSCDFTKGHPCLYDSSTIANGAQHKHSHKSHFDSLFPLKIYKHPTTSQRILPSTSTPIDNRREVASWYDNILQLHHWKGSAILFVCNDSANKELESCFKVEGKDGDDYIEMLPSDTKVYLIARLEKGGTAGSLTIHRLQLTDVADNNAC
uniref:MAM domain-containing protein n=1 Tax=Heterorhabditis bacteriophora TaxID=37862 RepID=A0A1I7XDE9_HETBA